MAIAPMLLLPSNRHTEGGYVHENYSLFNWMFKFFLVMRNVSVLKALYICLPRPE